MLYIVRTVKVRGIIYAGRTVNQAGVAYRSKGRWRIIKGNTVISCALCLERLCKDRGRDQLFPRSVVEVNSR